MVAWRLKRGSSSWMRRISRTAASSGLRHTMWSMACASRSSEPTFRRVSPEKYDRTRLRRLVALPT